MPTQVFTSGSSFTVPNGYILSRIDLAGGGGGGGGLALTIKMTAVAGEDPAAFVGFISQHPKEP